MSRREPALDRDGYPAEETLRAIRDWPWNDLPGLLEFCSAAWRDPEDFQRVEPPSWAKSWREGATWWQAVTSGWSGNESIISALADNAGFWTLCWAQSRRGGLHHFVVPEVDG